MPHASRAEHYRREVSRIEGFSDAVFAFAVTLLVQIYSGGVIAVFSVFALMYRNA